MPAVRQTTSLAAGVVLVAAGLAVGVSPATAVGTLPAAGKALAVTPAQGNDNIRPTLATSTACPAGSTFYFTYLYGPGLPDDGQPMLNQPSDSVPVTAGPFNSQTDLSFKETAAKAGASLVAGTYVVRLVCLDDLSNVKDAFTRQVVFSSATAWAVSGAGGSATPTATSSAPSTRRARSARQASASVRSSPM